MNESLKKVMVTGASLLMLASVGAAFSNLSNGYNVHAAKVEELQNNPKYFHGFWRYIPMNVNHNFHRHGYLFNVETIRQQMRHNHNRPADYDPIIVGVNGDTHLSNHQVIQALEGKRIFGHHRREVRKHVIRRHRGRHHAKRHARRHGRRNRR